MRNLEKHVITTRNLALDLLQYPLNFSHRCIDHFTVLAVLGLQVCEQYVSSGDPTRLDARIKSWCIMMLISMATVSVLANLTALGLCEGFAELPI